MVETGETRAVAQARAAIAKHRLTSLDPACLKLELDTATGAEYVFNVYEFHDAKCGGDPESQPRLFGLSINSSTGVVSTDANSEDGELQPLK